MENLTEFTFKGQTFKVHYSADGYGIYGISKEGDEYITFVNKLKHRYNKEYRQAFAFATKKLGAKSMSL